jgi:hypothetical protein
MANFIPVTERLPEGEDAVTCEAWCAASEDFPAGPCVMMYDADEEPGLRWQSREDTGCWRPGEVTHWRPRSKAPHGHGLLDAPKRACRFVLDLEADTRQDLAGALFNISSRIERGEMTHGVSGGYSSGYIYELTENDTPTHDEWAERLRTYLDEKKAPADGNGGS